MILLLFGPYALHLVAQIFCVVIGVWTTILIVCKVRKKKWLKHNGKNLK